MGDRPARPLILLAIAASLLPNVLIVPGHASHDGQRLRCFGRRATIVGTDGDDVVIGSRGDDVIVALDGSDEVYGLGGRDVICSGAGEDVADGGAGFDLVAGGNDADEVFGGKGSDFVAEDHRLFALADAGTESADDVYGGGPGDDYVADDAGSDSIEGGAGKDTFFGVFSYEPLVVDLARGVAVTPAEVNTLSGIENAVGSLASDVVVGDDGPNVLMGLFGPDVVLAGGGPDLVMSEGDGDVIAGGDAVDALFATVNERVEADLEQGTMTTAGGGEAVRFTGVEDFIGTAKDDLVVGSDDANRLYGGSGDDALDGASGNDSIIGDSPLEPWIDIGRWKMEYPPRGHDLLDGGDGRDLLDGGPFRDICRNGERLRRCESRRGRDVRPVAARANAWRPAAPLRTWLLGLLTADSPSEFRAPRWGRG
ncbi:MAG: calcium-binding protein [Actinomycetota bacterium]|nr:calcium-binding protein [Actinomycetota bacterium]